MKQFLSAGHLVMEMLIVLLASSEAGMGMHLTHWGRVTHICVSKLTIIGSDNGLSPGRRQAIIGTNAGILLIRPLGTNFIGILIEIHTLSFKNMHFKMSSGIWRPFCLGLNVLTPAGFLIKEGLVIENTDISHKLLNTQCKPDDLGHHCAHVASMQCEIWI